MIKKMACTVEAKKWGNSIGIVIPSDVVKGLEIIPGAKLDVDFKEKKRLDGFGIWKDIAHKPYVKEAEDERIERMFKHFDKKSGGGN